MFWIRLALAAFTRILAFWNAADVCGSNLAVGTETGGRSPILAALSDKGKVRFEAATDREVLDAFALTMQKEGLIPALESAHAIAHVSEIAPKMSKDTLIVINLSGRGDKDLDIVNEAMKNE